MLVYRGKPLALTSGDRSMNTRRISRLACAAVAAYAATGSGQTFAQGAYATVYNNIFSLAISSYDQNGANGPFFVPLTDFTAFTVFSATNAQLNGQIDPGNLPNSDSAGGPAEGDSSTCPPRPRRRTPPSSGLPVGPGALADPGP